MSHTKRKTKNGGVLKEMVLTSWFAFFRKDVASQLMRKEAAAELQFTKIYCKCKSWGTVSSTDHTTQIAAFLYQYILQNRSVCAVNSTSNLFQNGEEDQEGRNQSHSVNHMIFLSLIFSEPRRSTFQHQRTQLFSKQIQHKPLHNLRRIYWNHIL